jgi:Family of unknown function (DUF6527)
VKVKPVRTDAGNLVGYGFYCPGCDHGHVFYTAPVDRSVARKASAFVPAPGAQAPPKPSEPSTWEFNGDLDKPTFKPSLLNTCVTESSRSTMTEGLSEPHPDPKQRRCHLVLTDGVIHYCGDCTHDLKGQSIPLEHHWEDS